MRDDFGIFVLSHGRPDQVEVTMHALLRRGRYTGRWWIVIDSEDETGPQYVERWGADHVLVFDKDDSLQDMADNGGPRGVIIYARNASARLAADLGLAYYMQLDDDYTYFAHRLPDPDRPGLLHYAYTYRMDDVLTAYVDFLENTGALTVAFGQGGDFIGGLTGDYMNKVVKRKAMNTMIARVSRPIHFVGRINEDVNTYVWRGTQGELFLTTLDFMVQQKVSQSQGGGMTETYLDRGTYVKSFYTVMFAPSCVKIATLMGEAGNRVHHQVNWAHAVPKIVSSRHRKEVAA